MCSHILHFTLTYCWLHIFEIDPLSVMVEMISRVKSLKQSGALQSSEIRSEIMKNQRL